mmetsp:Transcript_31513/g.92427  ORF Transcript_31513/g.92427 Transcript_31513/m.92427 type:complete len:325 (+) Transcript_31513:109-1083(+)
MRFTLSAAISALFSTTRRSTATAAALSTSNSCSNMPPSIKVVPNSKLFVSEPDPSRFGNPGNPMNDAKWTNSNWLKSRFHFSFAEYSSRHNQDFGVLRVMNDDLVQPNRGFGTHPHRDMEIITYIVEGELTHKDSMGTEETLGRGSIQFMTAGTGVRHSEHNLNKDKPLRFIQTWITPSGYGLTPNYGSCSGNASERKGKLQHLVSNAMDPSTKTPVEINQDCDAFAAELAMGESVELDIPGGRMAYLLCMEGGVKLSDEAELKRHDAAEITTAGGSVGLVKIEATETEKVEDGSEVAHVLVFIMRQIAGAGRNDLCTKAGWIF